MSKNIENFFSFRRHLPKPFDGTTARRTGVQSKYGTGNIATLCSNIVKAIIAYCACKNGSGDGALGLLGSKCVAEYKSAASADAYHLVVFDKSSGTFSASVYDKANRNIEVYQLDETHRDGAALIFAMIPALLEDDEFRENLSKYFDHFMSGYADMDAATENMAILCDNVYRRIKDDKCAAYINVALEASGRMNMITKSQIDYGGYTPRNVVVGDFSVFTGISEDAEKAEVLIEHKDFVGRFPLQKRTLSALEKQMVPKLSEWYIIPKEVVDICKHASATTGKPTQMRNFLLRGPAGTGKTLGAQAIAAGLGLPYMKYTCSANTEIYDFIGQIFPDSENASTTKDASVAELEQLRKMGGVTYANVSKLMGIPSLDDMEYDPSGTYKLLTGTEKNDATPQECMSEVLEKVTQKVNSLFRLENSKSDKGQSFSYIETDFVKALKNGYVVEIQEPTVIMQAGVLVGLNSLLEQNGSITLPTGEIVKRHPDAVVVVTTNTSYEGCRGMNQSVIDRMCLVRDVELPSPEIMAQRAMSVTGVSDFCEVVKKVKVVNAIDEYCHNNSISDGAVGMRGLLDWIVSAEVTGDSYESALYTVISKATEDAEEREAIITTVLEPVYRPLVRKKVA